MGKSGRSVCKQLGMGRAKSDKKVFKTAVKTMLYGLESVVLQEAEMEAAEVKIMRFGYLWE